MMNPANSIRLKRLQGDRDIIVCKGGVSDVQAKLNKIIQLHEINILGCTMQGDQICVIVERIRISKEDAEI